MGREYVTVSGRSNYYVAQARTVGLLSGCSSSCRKVIYRSMGTAGRSHDCLNLLEPRYQSVETYERLEYFSPCCAEGNHRRQDIPHLAATQTSQAPDHGP